MFFYRNESELEINSKWISGKCQIIWKLKHMYLNNSWVNKGMK